LFCAQLYNLKYSDLKCQKITAKSGVKKLKLGSIKSSQYFSLA